MSKEKKSNKFKTTLFIVTMIGVIVLLSYLSSLLQDQPPIPRDIDHLDLIDPDECLRCHGDKGLLPLSDAHPINQKRCLNCHQYEELLP